MNPRSLRKRLSVVEELNLQIGIVNRLDLSFKVSSIPLGESGDSLKWLHCQ